MEAEDFQQGWKQKRAAVEGHRSKELRERPQAANEGSRQRETGRASRAKWPRKRGRDALARKACVWINAGVGRRGGAQEGGRGRGMNARRLTALSATGSAGTRAEGRRSGKDHARVMGNDSNRLRGFIPYLWEIA